MVPAKNNDPFYKSSVTKFGGLASGSSEATASRQKHQNEPREKPQAEIYLVAVCSAKDENNLNIMFATTSKNRAEEWRDKYNRIVSNNEDRIKRYYDDLNYNKPEPLWFYAICFDSPVALVMTTELR